MRGVGMSPAAATREFLRRQWLVALAGAGVAVTSLAARRLPAWSVDEGKVLFLLSALFVAVRGLEQSGLAGRVAGIVERGGAVPLKLVAATFFLSMLVTNDAALVIVVPLTLSLACDRKDILVILEALAANAGSALTPFGNPQNLYLYWRYDVAPGAFVGAIAPFSLVFLGLLLAVASRVDTRCAPRQGTPRRVARRAWIHGLLLAVVVLAVLRVLPAAAGIVVVLYALVWDRAALAIDYPLLLTFLFFFGIADNLRVMLAAEIGRPGHVFLTSALASQVVSNVPAALLLSEFTSRWPALLWGVNAGGFGSLFGSLANLIAYRLYVVRLDTRAAAVFTGRFLALGYAALFVAFGLYFLLRRMGGLP